MRVAVMGAGSIGGYFGGMLAHAGHQVTLIARGENLRILRERGLEVIRDEECFTLTCPQQIEALADPSQAGVVDLVLLTVKTYQNLVAVPALAPLVGDSTTILGIQNGIDSYQAAAQRYGIARVMPGAAYIEASRPGPGQVRQTGDVVRIVFGEEDGATSARGLEIQQALEQSGIPAELSPDIRKTLWTKFLFIATMAGVTSLSRERMAELMPRPEWRRVIEGCMKEIEAVARGSGIALEDNIVANTLAYIEGSLENMHASMHSDIMAGRPLELEALTGAAIRAGTAAGVATPINDLIYAMLQPWAAGAAN